MMVESEVATHTAVLDAILHQKSSRNVVKRTKPLIIWKESHFQTVAAGEIRVTMAAVSQSRMESVTSLCHFQ